MGAVSEIRTVKDKKNANVKRESGKLQTKKRKLRREAEKMEQLRLELLEKEQDLKQKLTQTGSYGSVETILSRIENTSGDQRAMNETLFQLRRELQRKDELIKEEK
mmetsp:Transcript_35452/g.43356  ORF Transcript_35452/g.43356 Transcript_35452/m.43356 type:complete len:106 (+) Transcript_35452:1339-1656(+)